MTKSMLSRRSGLLHKILRKSSVRHIMKYKFVLAHYNRQTYMQQEVGFLEKN